MWVEPMVGSPLGRPAGLAGPTGGLAGPMRRNAVQWEGMNPDVGPWDGPLRNGADVRRKLSAQIDSVVQKGLPYRLRRILVDEHRLPEDAVPWIVDTCLRIIWQRAGNRAPNQVWLNAPAGVGPGSRRYATRQLQRVLVTPVDEDDLAIWYESGLGAMQRARLLRTLEQAERQGGQFQLRELAALHNLTVNATKERLRPLREAGVRLAYHGRSHSQRRKERIGRLWLAVERLLEGHAAADVCELCGLSSRRLPEVVAWWARTAAAVMQGQKPADVARREGLSLTEVEEAVRLGRGHAAAVEKYNAEFERPPSAWPLRAHDIDGGPAAMERTLSEHLHRGFGWSARRISVLTAQLYASADVYRVQRDDDEILYEAVADEEPLGRPLRDCAVETVKVRLATEEEGVGGDRPDRITDVKRTKLERYAQAAAQQNTFLTNADLCYLLGVHTDVVSRLLRESWAREVPTRQRAWERRVNWLSTRVEVAERMLRGVPVDRACSEVGVTPTEVVDEVGLLVRVARDIEAGRSSNEIVSERDAPRWLIDRLTQHPSLSLLARLHRNGRAVAML